ncbi:protein TolR [Agitococcus lubricus]|uniref:Outer membrane transport energization protein ExbD n=1 Tax=Agitococcus lubricus TaxID=1077255 RepID=A0A2T5IZB4_9GAMM|nr:protein TolR [Agitococcus lubricus]PTQ89350.1 outer membrane transport energization protein ExbD [Agitococcus lubricus]
MSFNIEGGDDEMMSEINMTPLVDVMLVLLIIFIITVPVLTHAVKVDLPRANNQPNQVQQKPISISINAQGQVFWNDTPIEPAALAQQFSQIAQQQPQPEVHIRGDRKVEYEYVMQVMAQAQRSGVQKLGFITEPKY